MAKSLFQLATSQAAVRVISDKKLTDAQAISYAVLHCASLLEEKLNDLSDVASKLELYELDDLPAFRNISTAVEALTGMSDSAVFDNVIDALRQGGFRSEFRCIGGGFIKSQITVGNVFPYVVSEE